MNTSQWYVAIEGRTSGPLETEVVLDGLRQGSVPPSAHVCLVGAGEWTPISEAPAFRERLQSGGAGGTFADAVGGRSAAGFASGSHPTPGASTAGTEARERAAGTAASAATAIDWTEPLLGYLAHWHDAALPPESVLMRDLDLASPEVLIQQQSVWNLALCVAMGSESLSAKASEVLFTTLERFGRPDRLAWILRALSGKGFVASEIPDAAAKRALERLMRACPPRLLAALNPTDSTMIH